MILFFKSLIDTFSELSWVDIIFFFAVIFLIILVVTLLYFILINKEEVNKLSLNMENHDNNKNDVKIFEDPNEEGELLDLKALTKKLEEKQYEAISMNDYEEEQEQKAIISYDELLKHHRDTKINYEDEKQTGDLTIKKIDLDNLNTPIQIEKKVYPKTISYEKEEAFLQALKKLQEQIN